MTYKLSLTQLGTRVSLNFDCDTPEEADHIRQQITMRYLDKAALVITFKADSEAEMDVS